MRLLTYLSYFIIPFLLVSILLLGYYRKCNVYEEFLKGAKEGLLISVKLLPTLVGLLTAVGILRASGFLELLGKILGGVTEKIGLAPQLVPIAVVRLFSSSAATGLVLDLFKEYGTDSVLGLTASVMMSCTETVFYTMTIYFTAAKVTRTRYTLAGALAASAAGIAASVVLAGWMG